MNNNDQNIYCAESGNIFNFLHYSLQDSQYPHPIIILIYPFLRFKNYRTMRWISPDYYAIRHNWVKKGMVNDHQSRHRQIWFNHVSEQSTVKPRNFVSVIWEQIYYYN